jgi:uncharacterized protein DUF6152
MWNRFHIVRSTPSELALKLELLMPRVLACVLALTAAAAAPAFAHHSFALFDMDKNLTIAGAVVEYRWSNPHVQVLLKVDPGADVPADSVGTWDLEAAGSTNIMARQGWSRTTLKAGDRITAVFHPTKEGGGKSGSLFYIILPDGNRLYTDIARPKPGT